MSKSYWLVNFAVSLTVVDWEKVYDVSGTPPQHLVGVSKTNKKLTSVLKKRNISLMKKIQKIRKK